MEQLSCWVQHIAYNHLFQHPADPGRLWCLLFPKATRKNVLHSGLHLKSVMFLLQGHNYCSVLVPLLFTTDNVRSLAQRTVLFGNKNNCVVVTNEEKCGFCLHLDRDLQVFPPWLYSWSSGCGILGNLQIRGVFLACTIFHLICYYIS